jgi:hypothetical protein
MRANFCTRQRNIFELIAAAAPANCFIVVGGKHPETPLSAALGFTCGGLAAAGSDSAHAFC